ncbi:hypothetical protein D3C76_662460 [compost metagenome]
MRRFDDGLGDGVSRGLRQRSGQDKQMLRIGKSIDFNRLQVSMPAGEGAGLVKKNLFDPCQRFQRRSILDQDPAPCRSRNT